MRKIITIVATLAFVIALSMTAFAATNWKYDEATQVWSCTDKNGDAVTEQWVKSGDDWFWLDEEGKMATGTLVDDGNGLFCVDEKGQMIKSNWVKVNNDDFDDKWLYFGSNGKAYQDGWKTIKNEKYHFSSYAMDEGFLDENGAMIDAEVEAPWLTAAYYVGNDGAMKKNYWLAVEDFDSADGKNWVFFGANGKKVADVKKTINGKTYVFGTDGLMKTSFLEATVSSAPVSAYMDENGAMLKKGWIYAYANENAEEQNWFYAAANGQLVKDVVKTINGKKYAFDGEGKMLTGAVQVNENGTEVIGKICSAGDVTPELAYDDYATMYYMYFTESATPSEQGAAVTGKTNLNGYDWPFTVDFSNRGIAKTTVYVVKNNTLYKNSVLVADAGSDYKYLPIKVDGVEYVFTTATGKVAKKGTFTDSGNEIQYKFVDGALKCFVKNDKGQYKKEVTITIPELNAPV